MPARPRVGQPELAGGSAGGMFAGVPHAFGQLGQAGPHLERLVGPAGRSAGVGHRQPQCALYPVEGRDDGHFRGHPRLDSIALAYLPQNSPPVVRGITVVIQRRLPRRPPDRPARAPPPTGDRHGYRRRGHPHFRRHTHSDAVARRLSADRGVLAGGRSDGDRLLYSLYFRGEDETQWLPLKADTHDNAVTFDADILADGKILLPRAGHRRESNRRPARARPN